MAPPNFEKRPFINGAGGLGLSVTASEFGSRFGLGSGV